MIWTVSCVGPGHYGHVRMAVRKSDGQKVAIKFIRKSGSEIEDYLPGYHYKLPLEVVLMSLVKDININIIELFEDPETIVLVMEYLETFVTLQSSIVDSYKRVLCGH
ncbi:serine threonine- kinase pim-2-like protein [Labeo rohita]|uniref:non-specific serine/threonine protein kinase n=1 Tax=Labeo rohita TaxID=84645 RepID=A0A498LY65_LABRO|nr:serine threonine- kinase pim-2-like protein [Labeo rohita]RXN38201.1 serine threonine- kinase pim-2-like protein [Labeo rohita]